jgi:thioredoxin reductase (NADPH)
MKIDKDLIVIGAGAGGLSAAQYAARANLSVLVIEELAAGGQCLIIDRLENYPGFPESLSGFEMSQKLEKQARNFGAEFLNATTKSIEKQSSGGTAPFFIVDTTNGKLAAHAVIIATGAKHRTLDIPGEKEFSGKGVSYCATCDGPFFKGKSMLVVGGGDAACDEAMFLANLTDRIIMIHRKDRFRAQKALAQRVLNNPHIEVRFNTELKEIIGTDRVAGAKLYNNKEEKLYSEELAAVFIFIGSIPQSRMIEGLELDEADCIITNQKMETNIRGVYAAGDVRSTPFRQLVVAAGEGAIAAHSVSQYIDELKGEAYV